LINRNAGNPEVSQTKAEGNAYTAGKSGQYRMLSFTKD
jgi:hypothetical protein